MDSTIVANVSAQISNIVRGITLETVKMFKIKSNSKEAIVFAERLRQNIEKQLVYQLKTYHRYEISFGSKGNKTTPNICLALKSSGISKDGTIPDGCMYYPKKLEN